jgi:hypothetical protein
MKYQKGTAVKVWMGPPYYGSAKWRYAKIIGTLQDGFRDPAYEVEFTSNGVHGYFNHEDIRLNETK